MLRGMHKGIVIAPILLSVLALLIPMSAKALNVGDKAPDFLAFSTVGETVRLSYYQAGFRRRLNQRGLGFPTGSPQVRKP
jgi:hypothetical protein